MVQRPLRRKFAVRSCYSLPETLPLRRDERNRFLDEERAAGLPAAEHAARAAGRRHVAASRRFFPLAGPRRRFRRGVRPPGHEPRRRLFRLPRGERREAHAAGLGRYPRPCGEVPLPQFGRRLRAGARRGGLRVSGTGRRSRGRRRRLPGRRAAGPRRHRGGARHLLFGRAWAIAGWANRSSGCCSVRC